MAALVKPSERQSVALLNERQREAVLAYCKIAATSGALLSLRHLVELLAIDATEAELEVSISSDEYLASKVFVESGHVLMRQPGSDRGTAREATEEEARRRDRAIANIKAGRAFARLLGKDMILVAVAGTNSYLSAGVEDDIDFYCITKTDGMWAFMLKSLVLARVSSMVRRHAPPFCFSFVLDEKRASEEISRPKNALYARDALTAVVLSSNDAYSAILANSSWMGAYFPNVYERRLAETSSAAGQHQAAKKGSRIVNSWLFLTLGSYVSLKAWIMNRKLAKQGRTDAIFRTTIGPGHLEYASKSYLELAKMYQAVEKR